MMNGISTGNVIANTTETTAIKSAGAAFVFRTYGNTTALGQNEASRITLAGLAVAALWITSQSATPGYFTHENGYQDGKRGWAAAKQAGQLFASAIYFAVNYNASPANFGAIVSYFEGVLQGFAEMAGENGGNSFLVGVYGNGSVCQEIKNALGLATFSFLWVHSSAAGGSFDVVQTSGSNAPCSGLSFLPDCLCCQAQGYFGQFPPPPLHGLEPVLAILLKELEEITEEEIRVLEEVELVLEDLTLRERMRGRVAKLREQRRAVSPSLR